MADKTNITMNLFLTELKKRVSDSNARLLLHTVTSKTGINYSDDLPLKSDEAHTLCMELLKHGGPGFQAGRTIYSQISK